MLQVNQVIKTYKTLTAVNQVSFHAAKGEIFGLLGPNGAGKSSLINCICGLSAINSGTIVIGGYDIAKEPLKAKQLMGVVPQDIAVLEELTAYENCALMGSLYGFSGRALKDRVKHALECVGLWERQKEKPGKFSGGMKRRLNIACAIVQDPKILIMDEPTVGVDPQSRNYILESIQTISSQGTTVIYTSHYMEEIEEICGRAAIMDLGSIIAEGTIDELIASVSDQETAKIHLVEAGTLNIAKIRQINGVQSAEAQDQILTVRSAAKSGNIGLVLEVLQNSNIHFDSVEMIKPSLEYVFLEKTGKKLRD